MSDEKMIPQKPVLEVLCAIQRTLSEENQKIFAKVSNTLGKISGNSVPPVKNLEAMMQQIADYLRDDVKLAENITGEKQGQDYIIENRGRYICRGKLVKERCKIKPACAMSLFPAGALTENLKIKNVRLKDSRKPGPLATATGSTKFRTKSHTLF